MNVDDRLARGDGINAARAGENNGAYGARQKENREWFGFAAQEFWHPRNKKILHSATPAVYPSDYVRHRLVTKRDLPRDIREQKKAASISRGSRHLV
jgi:hypothetical protein